MNQKKKESTKRFPGDVALIGTHQLRTFLRHKEPETFARRLWMNSPIGNPTLRPLY